MNYHTAIEQLRDDLHNNRDIYTLEQRQAGYLRLIELTSEYLASEGR